MSNSLKIFRPWDVHQDLYSNCEDKNNIPEMTHQLMEESSRIEENTNYLVNRFTEVDVESDTTNSSNESRQFSDLREKIITGEKYEISKRKSHGDKIKEAIIIDTKKRYTNNTSDSQSKDIDKSFQCDKTRHHRRYSRKHKKSISEIHSSLSSPSNITMPSIILDTSLNPDPLYQTDLNLTSFEKQFYPDFRSLEFLPEEILDPILMSGLPLGAPLDPYWSNLALEYFKNQEANMKNKQARPKKFNCPYCNVAFSNNGQLKGHIRIHTGERPFKCDADGCGKSFTRNEELTRHKRIHSGLRPYPCSHCGKKFGRKDHLKKHLRTHFPQPRFVPLYSPYMYGGYGTVML